MGSVDRGSKEIPLSNTKDKIYIYLFITTDCAALVFILLCYYVLECK